MSKSFSFDEETAKEFGVEEAVVIRSFQFWIDLNKANGRNLREGRTWTYNTYESLAEQFPFWIKKDKQTGAISPDVGKIRRLMDSLISKGVLIKTNKFNKWKIDNTNWYAFEDEERWLKVKSVENFPLPKNADEETLFDNLQTENVAEGENDENSHLLNSADVKVNDLNLSDSSSAENNNPSAEKSRPEGEKDSSGLSNSADLSLRKNADQYQILNQILNKVTKINISSGDGDKFNFNFSDTDALDRRVTELFQSKMNAATPHPDNVYRVKCEIIDSREELSRWVCWNIIVRVFMMVPGWEKKFQTVDSILGKIQKMKDRYAEQYYLIFTKGPQKIESETDRIKSRENEIKEAEVTARKYSELCGRIIEKYKNILSAAIINEANDYLSRKLPMNAYGVLDTFLLDRDIDIHNDSENAA